MKYLFLIIIHSYCLAYSPCIKYGTVFNNNQVIDTSDTIVSCPEYKFKKYHHIGISAGVKFVFEKTNHDPNNMTTPLLNINYNINIFSTNKPFLSFDIILFNAAELNNSLVAAFSMSYKYRFSIFQNIYFSPQVGLTLLSNKLQYLFWPRLNLNLEYEQEKYFLFIRCDIISLIFRIFIKTTIPVLLSTGINFKF